MLNCILKGNKFAYISYFTCKIHAYNKKKILIVILKNQLLIYLNSKYQKNINRQIKISFSKM